MVIGAVLKTVVSRDVVWVRVLQLPLPMKCIVAQLAERGIVNP